MLKQDPYTALCLLGELAAQGCAVGWVLAALSLASSPGILLSPFCIVVITLPQHGQGAKTFFKSAKEEVELR